MKVQLLSDTAKVPVRAHSFDAGYDLFSNETVCVAPGDRHAVKTGIAIGVPVGHVGLIWEKSGLALREGLQCMGGVIDAGYTGEVKVIVYNTSGAPLQINAGQKIAQILLQHVYLGDITVVDSLDETRRGSAGFGSTGKV